MNDFRKMTPKRRTQAPAKNRYGDYKPFLRIDFNERCGYCGDHDFFRDTYYEVDHFIPKDLAPNKENDYSNLVYSCRTCNNSKRKKWPTNDITKPNDGKVGFVDPCDSSYGQHFERLADGSIKSRTPLGLWMWKNLALSNPSHRIHWMLEELKTELKRLNSMEIDDIEILKKIQKLNSEYMDYEEKLRGTPNF